MRCHVDLSQDPLRVQPFLSKAEHFPPNSVMLELFIQESCVTMCSTRVRCILRWGLRGHEEIDLHLRVVLSSKSCLLVSQFDETRMSGNRKKRKMREIQGFLFHGYLDMANRWKQSILERAKVSNADGFKRRRDHRLCPLLKILRGRETSRNYRDWRSLRFIKLLNQSVLWDSNFQRAQDADQIRASVSMLEFLYVIPYVLCFGKNIQAPKLQYHAGIMPELSFSLQIASQVSPVHTTGKNAENLVINTKQQTFLSGFRGKKSIHWQNQFHWCLAICLRWKPGWQKWKIRCWLPFERLRISGI